MGMRGAHKGRAKPNINECTYIQAKSTYTIHYLADGPMDTHAHTPKESDQMVFIRTSSPEDSRAEDQGLSWTCPPRVVFKLTQSGERRAKPGYRRSILAVLAGTGVARALDRDEEDKEDDDDDQDQLLPRLQTSGRRRRRRRKKTLEDARNTNQEDARTTTTTFCLSLPFLFLPGAARFRHGSFAVSGGCRIPFLGVPKRIQGWGPTFPLLSTWRMPGATGFSSLFSAEP